MPQNDQTEAIQSLVIQALETESSLQIVGGASKTFYGRKTQGKVLSIKAHQGIINYHPSELIITARAGTLLSEIESTLAEQGQMLAFEPPYFAKSATIGGTVACGFSGPRRPFTGSVRDFVLGCKIINGKAEILSFGGEVMKNVAGYDISRLMVGAMGTLGVLLEVSLKVLPKPVIEDTRVFELNTATALGQMTEFAKKNYPLSGLSYDGIKLYARISGTEKAVKATKVKLGGGDLIEAKNFWNDCKEHRLNFFQNTGNLWRLSVPPSASEPSFPGLWFYDWGGAQRWLKTAEKNQQVFSLAESMDGHATLFRARDQSDQPLQKISEPLKKLNKKIKHSFDPKGILNPYRINGDW